MRGSLRAWSERMSLRLRMVLTAVLVVTMVVVGGAVLFVWVLRSMLIEGVDELGEVRADQLEHQAARGLLPPMLARADDVEAAAQVIRGGEVISSTYNATNPRTFPLEPLPPGEEELVPLGSLPIDDDGPFRVLARGIETPEGPATVFVAVDIEDINEVTAALVQVGTVGLVLLLLAVGGLFWVIVGRTLRPVEAIRTRAEAISGHRRMQRVPEPPRLDEIGRLARTINAMLARLEDGALRQERFVADAAHELRTPLATLRATLEAAREQPGGPRVDEELLADMWQQTTRMSLLVDGLLLLARSDSGTAKVGAEPVDLDDVVTDVASATQVARGKSLTRRVEPVQVVGEPSLLELVVRNLLDNAMRHARSSVEVSLAEQSGRAVLTVDDDGPGIPPRHRREVFRRFVRLDDVRASGGGGAGLGLAIVRQIVALHGGTVEISESPSGGARLRVFLPLQVPEDPPDPADTATGRVEKEDRHVLNNHR